MATTTPFPFREHHDPTNHDAVMNMLIDVLVTQYEVSLADTDKTDDDASMSFYEGQIDVAVRLLQAILDIPDGDWDRYVDVTEPESNLNQNGEQL